MVVDIVAKTSSIEASLTRVESRIESFGTAIKGLTGILSVGAFAKFADDLINVGAALYESAEKANVNAQAFQKLAAVASAVGIGADQLAMAMGRFQRNVGVAATGTGQQADALKALGLSFKQVADLKPEDQFLMLGRRIQELSSVNDKARASMALFGRSFEELAPLFKMAEEEFKRIQENAPVMTDAQLKRLHDAETGMREFATSAKLLGASIIADVIGPLNQFLDLLNKLPKQAARPEEVNTVTASVKQFMLQALATAFPSVAPLFIAEQQKVQERAQAVQDVLKLSPADKAMLYGVKEDWKPPSKPLPGYGPSQAQKDLEKQLTGIHDIQKKIRAAEAGLGDMPSPYAAVLDRMVRAAPDVESQLRDAEAQFRVNMEELRKLHEEGAAVIQAPKAEDFKNLEDYYKAYSKALQHPAISYVRMGDEEYAERIKAEEEKVNDFRLKVQSMFDHLQPVQVRLKHAVVISDLEEAIRGFSMTMEGVFVTTLHQSGSFGRNLVRNIVQALEDQAIVKAASKMGEAIFDALANISLSNDIGKNSFWNVILGGIGALFGGPGSGASRVVPSTAPWSGYAGGGGFVPYQHGGSFKVGGHGGIDSQLVQFLATPGERVDVGGGGGPTISITNQIDARGADAERIMSMMPSLLNQASEKAKRDILTAFNRHGLAAPRAA